MTDRTPLVLIADDDPDAMELVTWYLADQGYEMIQARDGEQALAMARERLPDLILLDICMPVIDGFSVLEQLRQDPITQSIVVIIMTAAFGRRRDRLRGFALGADDYIIKPLDRRELTARIRSRLRGKLLEHEFHRHREEMEDLYRVTQGIATTLDPAQLAKELLAAAGKVIGAEDGWIILTNERNEPLHAVRYGQSLSPRAASHLARQSLTRGIGGVVSRTQTGLLIPDSAADKRYGTGELGLTGVRSVVSVPLIGRRHSRGVLTYAHSEPNRFTENHLRWLRTVAGQAAVALDNAFLYSGEQRRAVKFRLLNTVTQDISSVLEAERLLEVVANLVRRAFNHYYVGLGLLEQGGEIVIRAAALDDQDADLSSLLGSRCSEGVETWVAEHGRPLLLNDVRGDSRYRERACLAETRSELALPIHSQDGLIGVLDIRSRSLMAFDPGDVVMLETLAAQISIAIQNARLFRALRNERERLDAILNSVASPVLVTDEERRLLLANAAARQLLEIEPESIGAVIGHEIGHGFDDMGSTFDGDGVMRNWWTDEDKAAFEERTGKLVEQYNAFQPFDDLSVNGEFTLGENIGDLGGISIGLLAYQMSLNGEEAPVIDGFTGVQRVFLGFGQVWRGKYREEALRLQIETNPHSPSQYRANGSVRNVPEFYEAFDVSADDALYLAPEDRVKIW